MTLLIQIIVTMGIYGMYLIKIRQWNEIADFPMMEFDIEIPAS
jgi:hypothetical protein